MVKRILFLSILTIVTFSNVSWGSPYIEPENPVTGKHSENSYRIYKMLNDNDLRFEVFEKALIGYNKLLNNKKIQNSKYLTIIDLSLSANKNRFFLIDLKSNKIVRKSKVAHGRNSGGEFAKFFSNKVGSYKSSIGFYKTAETYHGKHGLSLRLDVLESSNNNARKRAIVIHSASYVSDMFIKRNGRLGRSLGCPSLPKEGFSDIIKSIKNGSVLFIYYPEESYLKNSTLVNI